MSHSLRPTHRRPSELQAFLSTFEHVSKLTRLAPGGASPYLDSCSTELSGALQEEMRLLDVRLQGVLSAKGKAPGRT